MFPKNIRFYPTKNQQLVVVGLYKQVDANVVLPYKIKSKQER
jgi:hypothetical protein